MDEAQATKNIREEYKTHIVKMFQLTGMDEAKATKTMDAVLEIETRLAKESYSAVQHRAPAANYHKMTLDELKRKSPDSTGMLTSTSSV